MSMAMPVGGQSALPDDDGGWQGRPLTRCDQGECVEVVGAEHEGERYGAATQPPHHLRDDLIQTVEVCPAEGGLVA